MVRLYTDEKKNLKKRKSEIDRLSIPHAVAVIDIKYELRSSTSAVAVIINKKELQSTVPVFILVIFIVLNDSCFNGL